MTNPARRYRAGFVPRPVGARLSIISGKSRSDAHSRTNRAGAPNHAPNARATIGHELTPPDARRQGRAGPHEHAFASAGLVPEARSRRALALTS